MNGGDRRTTRSKIVIDCKSRTIRKSIESTELLLIAKDDGQMKRVPQDQHHQRVITIILQLLWQFSGIVIKGK